MRKSIFVVIIFSMVIFGSLNAMAQEQSQTPKTDAKTELRAAEPPKVIAVEFYADWCQTCRALMPKITEAKKGLQGKAVLFTRFDMTDEFTKEQAAYMAGFAGLEDVYRRGNGKTGMVALVDAKSKKVLGVVGKDKTVDQIIAMVQDAISKAGSAAGG